MLSCKGKGVFRMLSLYPDGLIIVVWGVSSVRKCIRGVSYLEEGCSNVVVECY